MGRTKFQIVIHNVVARGNSDRASSVHLLSAPGGAPTSVDGRLLAVYGTGNPLDWLTTGIAARTTSVGWTAPNFCLTNSENLSADLHSQN